MEKAVRKYTGDHMYHASNMTGNMICWRVSERLRQSMVSLFIMVGRFPNRGVWERSMYKNMDFRLCFTGHKGLMGPQGTGGMYVKSGVKIRPLLSGSSG